MTRVGRLIDDAKRAPQWALIWLLAVIVAAMTLSRTIEVVQERLWSPFVGFEWVTFETDGTVLYWQVSGTKVTHLPQTAITTAVIIGRVPYSVACYRPDGTLCTPSPIVGRNSEFESSIMRTLLPAQVASDTQAVFRVCWTYGLEHFACYERPLADAAPVPFGAHGELQLIPSPEGGAPRAISPL